MTIIKEYLLMDSINTQMERIRNTLECLGDENNDISYAYLQTLMIETVQLVDDIICYKPKKITYSGCLEPVTVEKQICSICMDNNSNIITKCEHQYCDICIKKWLNKDNTCPCCRDKINYYIDCKHIIKN